MKKVLLMAVLPFSLLILLLFTLMVSAVANTTEPEAVPATGYVMNVNLSDAVLQYQSIVEQYCDEYGIREYAPYLLAIMMVESRGIGEDVMQASESLGLPPNSLQPEESIRQACHYFATLLNTAASYGCDIQTVIQSYNYGSGFVTFTVSDGGEYSFELAVEFARIKATDRTVEYNNPLAVEINGGWRYQYGNMFYVQLVMQYISTAAEDGSFIFPKAGSIVITSVYGNRNHPITGENKNHNGIDIYANFGEEVLASAAGTIDVSEYHSSYGNYIILDHGNGYKTLYAHCSQLAVNVGDIVQQGQVIGYAGQTGDATGVHIHLEIWLNGERTDPLAYFSPDTYTYS